MSMRVLAGAAGLLGAGVIGCGSPGASPLADAAAADLVVVRADAAAVIVRGLEHVPREVPRCERAGEVPLRTGDDIDATRCAALGAREFTGGPRWPSMPALKPPVLYVAPDAPAGGDGSQDRPLRTLAEAVAWSPAARTVVLSRGEHPVDAAITLSRDLSIVGGATALVLARGGSGLVVTAPARVALTAISLRYPPGRSTEGDVALAVRGGALWMRDVTVDDADIGLEAAGGTLDAERFTVRRSARYGVWGTANASLALTDFVVRDGAGQGIRVEGAHVRLDRGLVAGHARHGVVLLGDPNTTGGVARCGDAAPGSVDCIDQLCAQANGVAALYVSGARRVEVRRSTLADTALATIEGGEAGDGLFVGPEADVSLDPELVTAAVRGFGSALLGNGRVGLLAQGTRARVSVRGAVFARNAVGGVIIGNRAEATVIGESLFVENRFGGIVATPGAAMGVVQCNGIADTLAGTLRGGTVTVQLADGVHMNAVSGSISLRDNAIVRSAAFGVLVNAGAVTLQSNRGADNRFGVGLYGGATVMGDPSTIMGREAAPAAAPGLVPGL
jgi:hypothetical protein